MSEVRTVTLQAEYWVIEHENKEAFCKEVELFLRNGWELVGGVSIGAFTGKHYPPIYLVHYAQTVTRNIYKNVSTDS